jgi:4-alpha-glucanotransferase
VTLPATDLPFEYNMVILDESGNALCEEKEGHKVSAVVAGSKRVVTDTTFNYPDPTYKTAGVAVPVSGIKTRMSTGIGEFLDMKLLADWCEKTGLQMIQILPINDSGDDPSPYSASSSFALHPSYVRPLTVTEYYEKLVDLDASGLKGCVSSTLNPKPKTLSAGGLHHSSTFNLSKP